MIIDKLCEKIKETGNPSVIGLDTAADYLPDYEKYKDRYALAEGVTEFNLRIIDRIKSVVPAVKVQIAYYEAMGLPGMKSFADTCKAAHDAGMIVIADAKRNDIGATAKQYAEAFFGGGDFYCDFLTVNGYLGTDGISPFMKSGDKGIFVLVKTSNPSGVELQDMKLAGGNAVYEQMAELVGKWGESCVGENGMSNVGAVVGATYPEQAVRLREMLPHTFFLVPGYGAQGGGADGAVAGFDAAGGGGIVNSSRGIICAYKQEKYKGMSFDEAAYAACVDMREDLAAALARKTV